MTTDLLKLADKGCAMPSARAAALRAQPAALSSAEPASLSQEDD